MPTQQTHFELRLDQDVIISENSATTGQHQCLDHIPGATLQGLAASRLYSQLKQDQAWLLFHSGKVRITDAYPVGSHGEASWPMPLALHAYKGEAVQSQDSATEQLNAEALFHPCFFTSDPNRQPQQQRGGYLTLSGERVNSKRIQRMKTAIAPEKGRAADAQLFGYQSLESGQTFHFTLTADHDIDASLVTQLTAALCGPARLGRSRSAEYGGAQIQPASTSAPFPQCTPSATGLLQCWLLSDLALTGPFGDSTLIPSPEAFGLPSGSQWQPDASFIRTRSYSPFNGKRRCYDPQRQVLCRGSVIGFTLPPEFDAASLPEQLWVGQYQEVGLGRIVLNPRLLQGANPCFETKPAASDPPSAPLAVAPVEPQTPLIALLRRRVAAEQQHRDAQTLAEQILAELIRALQSARSWKGTRDYEAIEAPGNAQWGKIRQAANDLRQQPESLWDELFDPQQGLLRDKESQSWSLAIGPDTSLRDQLQTALNPHQKSRHFAELVSCLASLGHSDPTWRIAVTGNGGNHA